MKLLTRLAFLLCLLAATATAAPALPEIGTVAATTLSPSEERELGRQMMLELRRHLPLLEDPEIVNYIRDLGWRLATHSDMPSLQFEFFVVDHSAINAFAMPGGYIAVNAGLILNARSESELAGVLAHEIAHVTQRHIARRIAATERSSLQTLGMLLASVLIGSQDPRAGSALATAGMATSIQEQLNYSRSFEHEADRIGIRMLAAAELNPHGMPSFFGRLAQASRYYDRPPEYLSTHPATEARIAESAARADAYGRRRVFESEGFALMKTKLEALKAPPGEAKRLFEERLPQASGQARAAAEYGLALAQISAREFEPARARLEALLERRGNHPAYLLALGRLEHESGRLRASLARYEEALGLFPGHEPARIHYAETLIAAGESAKAYSVLSRALPSSDPRLYWLLAKAAADARRGVEPQLAMAEYYFLRNDLQAALIQLDQALASGRASAHESARAQARREELLRARLSN